MENEYMENEYTFLFNNKFFKKRNVRNLKMYYTDNGISKEPRINKLIATAKFNINGLLESIIFFNFYGNEIESSEFDLNGNKIRYKRSEDQSNEWESYYEIKYKYEKDLIKEKQIFSKTNYYHPFRPKDIVKEIVSPYQNEIFYYNLNSELVKIEIFKLDSDAPKIIEKKEYIYKNLRDYIVNEYEYSLDFNNLIINKKYHKIFDCNNNLIEEMILTGYDIVEDNDNYSTHNVYKYENNEKLIEDFYYKYKYLKEHNTYYYKNDLVVKIESEYNGRLHDILTIEYES